MILLISRPIMILRRHFFSFFFDSEYLCMGKRHRQKPKLLGPQFMLLLYPPPAMKKQEVKETEDQNWIHFIVSSSTTRPCVGNQNTRKTSETLESNICMFSRWNFPLRARGKLKKMDDMLQRLWAGHTMLQVCMLLYVLFTLWSTSKAFMNHIIYVSLDRATGSLSPQSSMWIMCVFLWICISHSQKMTNPSTHTISALAPLCGGFSSLNPISCTPGATLTR